MHTSTKWFLKTLFAFATVISFSITNATPWPIALTDTVVVEKNSSITITVLDNDTGDNLIIPEIDNWSEKSGYSVIDSTNKKITYTPAPNFIGTDSFWYEIVDNLGRTNAAAVNITVTDSTIPPPSDDAWPTATADNATTLVNQSVNIPVLNNDIGNELTITGVDTWTNAGRATIDPSNTFIIYTPFTGFSGTDSFWYDFKDNQGRTNAAEVTVQVTQQNTSALFSHVKMHYDLLNNRGIVWGEVGSQEPYHEAIQTLNIRRTANKGTTLLKVSSITGLLNNQLIVYRATNGQYYVNQIKSLLSNNRISLVKPLAAKVAKGKNSWNFYANPSHPNRYGYKAIADFSFRNLDMGSNTTGTHVLIGDSWFDNGGVTTQRFQQKLSQASIVNVGIGGETCQDLINRFDTDVSPHSPDTVWIMCGTNDYWQGVSTTTYKANIRTLINKSKAIGANAIVIDSSVGTGIGASGVPNLQQSEEYANAVLQLNQE